MSADPHLIEKLEALELEFLAQTNGDPDDPLYTAAEKLHHLIEATPLPSLPSPSFTAEEVAEMLDLEPIKARCAAASPVPWRSMERGNCTMENGLLAAIAEVEGLPRPWEPTWVGWKTAANYFKTFMRNTDAVFVANARTDVPALIAEVERLRERVLQTLRQATPTPPKETPHD